MDTEAPFSTTTDRKQGGWITFPFIMASTAALTLASGGWAANLIVYLIKEFHVKSLMLLKYPTLSMAPPV